MRIALALQVATFSRSLTARLATVLLAAFPPLMSVGMVVLARSADAAGPSAAKLAPYREGPFGETVAGLAGQVVSVVALIGVGFAVAWLVGREWADRTVGSLFALPVGRAEIARAKLVVVAAWAAASLTVAVALTAAVLALVDPAALTAAVAGQLVRVWLAGLLMAALALGFGGIAVLTRGYLGAAGAIVGVTAASQILAMVGLGAWVPYVAPAMWAGAGGPEEAAAIGPMSLAIAVAFAAAAVWASVRAFAHARLD
ncbi:ABC transporter permease [Demequina sp. SYSU T00192]|uniref:ABC transporter permease n=1 Tax=Demequina litoralis TaxID=3051660 RepID=A0ABT8G7V7_9MICO|nr:ABC transporter permease [Demequina sp. SYSU T00192]MDN4475210.1 ABC transporter permease [Demequina sp. SYSU T00192]